MSVLQPLSLPATLVSRKPATGLEAFNLSREAASATLESLTGASLFTREPGKIGPVCDCPAYQGSARVFTDSEREALSWLKNRSAKVIKPARRGSRLAALMQRLH